MREALGILRPVSTSLFEAMTYSAQYPRSEIKDVLEARTAQRTAPAHSFIYPVLWITAIGATEPCRLIFNTFTSPSMWQAASNTAAV